MSDPQSLLPADGILCPECDLPQRLPPLTADAAALCPRCGATLYRGQPEGMRRALACSLAGLLLFPAAMFAPFMTLDVGGRISRGAIVDGVAAMAHEEMWIVAVLVLITGTLAPLAMLLGETYLLLAIRWKRVPPWGGRLFRWLRFLSRWSMMEVYMLGLLVALVKLGDLAQVTPEAGLFAFGGLVAMSAASAAALEPRDVWAHMPLRALQDASASDAAAAALEATS
ncbi:paraquat-inducible protein A [Magnetofaba australis]|nr:paraquat-inducible protein A [Magnetofaba australis]